MNSDSREVAILVQQPPNPDSTTKEMDSTREGSSARKRKEVSDNDADSIPARKARIGNDSATMEHVKVENSTLPVGKESDIHLKGTQIELQSSTLPAARIFNADYSGRGKFSWYCLYSQCRLYTNCFDGQTDPFNLLSCNLCGLKYHHECPWKTQRKMMESETFCEEGCRQACRKAIILWKKKVDKQSKENNGSSIKERLSNLELQISKRMRQCTSCSINTRQCRCYTIKNLDWRNLPDEVIGDISELLSPVDFIQFSRVCGSWRRTLSEGLYLPTQYQEPWLMVKADNKDIQFLDIISGKVYKTVHEGGGYHLGATDEWLISVSPKLEETTIWNPMKKHDRGGLHHLPSILTLPRCQHDVDRRYLRSNKNENRNQPKMFPIRIKPFKYSTGGENDMIAIAIYDNMLHNIAYARPGDGTWTLVDVCRHRYQGYEDAVFFQGQIYGVLTDGEVNYWNITDTSTVVGVMSPLLPNALSGKLIYYQECYSKYFVTTATNRLLMLWSAHYRVNNLVGNLVFELDCDTKVWSRIHSLQGVLFSLITATAAQCIWIIILHTQIGSS